MANFRLQTAKLHTPLENVIARNMKPLVDSVQFFNSVILAKYSIVGRPTPPDSGPKLFPTLNVVIIILQLQIMPKNMLFSSVYLSSS